ncbi:hypothetical protein P1J78_22470, partial [Psychromarinibacter sp. C21-152]
MNKAITDGLALMPPPFADGLDVWSSENGTPGSATYDGAANAAVVPADQDFGGCLELEHFGATLSRGGFPCGTVCDSSCSGGCFMSAPL